MSLAGKLDGAHQETSEERHDSQTSLRHSSSHFENLPQRLLSKQMSQDPTFTPERSGSYQTALWRASEQDEQATNGQALPEKVSRAQNRVSAIPALVQGHPAL